MDLEPCFLLKDHYLMKFLDQDHADRDRKNLRMGLDIIDNHYIGAGATKKMKQISFWYHFDRNLLFGVAGVADPEHT